VESYAVAVIVDLDDYLEAVQHRGQEWGRRAHAAADGLVRAACRTHADTQVQGRPPDSWLITLSRPSAESIAADAHDLALLLRNEIAAHAATTASIAISDVVEGQACGVRAAGQAEITLGRKTLGGTSRVLATVEHRTFQPPDIAKEVTSLLRAGATHEAVTHVERWIGHILHRQANPSLLFGTWLPGLVLDVATTVDPRRAPDGSPDWRSTLGHIPIGELAELAGMHERSILHAWLTACFARLAGLARRDAEPLADRAEELLRTRFTDPGLSLNAAAAMLAVSPYHLAHVLQRDRNTTFRGYLTGLRVRKALGMLSQSDLPIAEIGRRCGFHTTRQFRATLHRELGSAPSRLR
jgi:AraC-like DNA-binding protein